MKKVFTSLFIFALLAGLMPVPAKAVMIAPTRVEYSGDPGEVIKGVVKVTNDDSDQPLTFYASVANFKSADNEEGHPEFMEEPKEATTDLASWIKLSETEITVEPKQKKEVEYEIVIPPDGEPGGHYAGIFWGTGEPETTQGTSISLIGKTASLVLLRVNGPVSEAGRLIEFGTEGDKKFFNRRPVDMFLRFENTGSVHLKPLGGVGITNVFGKKVADVDINDEKGNVLPNSVRRFRFKWDASEAIAEKNGNLFSDFIAEFKNEISGFAFGKYKANLVVAHGKDNISETAHISFWVIPWRVLSAALLALIIVLFILISGLKNYNKWIIKKALKQEEKK